MPADARSFVSGIFAFELDGVKCGFVKSIEGGAISAEVIEEPTGPDHVTRKHIGQPKYEEFELRVDFPLPKPLQDWISSTWQANHQRKNGLVVACDFQRNAIETREFKNALITEVAFPACDAASKEPAYLSVKFAPEYVHRVKAGGKYDAPIDAKAQKKWLPANFRLEIPTLDCSRVNRIDAFTVKQRSVADAVGEQRDYAQEPAKVEIPNLRITMAETGAPSWYDWFEDFVISGNNSQEHEKNGRLTLLSPDHQTELAHVDFFNLGIFRLARTADVQAGAIARVVADLYCERMELHAGVEIKSVSAAFRAGPLRLPNL